LSFFLFLYIFICLGSFVGKFAGFLLYMQSPFSFEFDLKIEMTFCSRRMKLRIEEQRLMAEAVSWSMPGIGGDQKRTLRDFVIPRLQRISSSIAFLWVRRQAYGIKSLPSLKRKMRCSMKPGSSARTFYDYALTMVFKGGCSCRHFILESLSY